MVVKIGVNMWILASRQIVHSRQTVGQSGEWLTLDTSGPLVLQEYMLPVQGHHYGALFTSTGINT